MTNTKTKCCKECLECPDYPNHNYCHNPDCKCHSSPSKPTEGKIESWEEEFDELYPVIIYSEASVGKPQIKDFISQSRADAKREVVERAILDVKVMKPILYSDDSEQHKRNITKYETLEEVLSLLANLKGNLE